MILIGFPAGRLFNNHLLLAVSICILLLPACRSQSNTHFEESIPAHPGLREADGTDHPPHSPHPVTGKTINVLEYGADPADSASDDMPAVRAALQAAASGDEVFFPAGTYNLQSPWDSGSFRDTHIRLASKVNLRGESELKVILKSSFDGGTFARPAPVSYSIMRAAGVHDIHVSGLTLTSTWAGAFSSDLTVNNPHAGGPVYMVVTAFSGSEYAHHITLEHITVEKFRRMGFRIDAGSRDIVIINCTARNATDLGGGGAGYGFVLQGRHPSRDDSPNPNLGTVFDNFFNAIINCRTDGGYIRHSALIQYYAHNNIITGCFFKGSRYGAVDLHGEDEYNNEISFNTIRDMSGAGAIELGNSGATHDKSGPHNWVHHNTIINCRDGIKIEYGTRYALIEENDISGNNSFEKGSGIRLGFCSFITVRNNFIHDNLAPGFTGILLFQNRAENASRAGAPGYCLITGNRILNNPQAAALVVSSSEKGNIIEKNEKSGNRTD